MLFVDHLIRSRVVNLTNCPEPCPMCDGTFRKAVGKGDRSSSVVLGSSPIPDNPGVQVASKSFSTSFCPSPSIVSVHWTSI